MCAPVGHRPGTDLTGPTVLSSVSWIISHIWFAEEKFPTKISQLIRIMQGFLLGIGSENEKLFDCISPNVQDTVHSTLYRVRGVVLYVDAG